MDLISTGSGLAAARNAQEEAAQIVELRGRGAVYAQKEDEEVLFRSHYVGIIYHEENEAFYRVVRPRYGYVRKSEVGETIEENLIYRKAMERAGGRVEEYREISRRIADKVALRNEKPHQRAMLALLGIDALYQEAKAVSPRFHRCVNEIAQLTGGMARVAAMKDRKRADFKAKIKYGSDCTRLVDILRATLLFTDLEALYNGLKALDDACWFDVDAGGGGGGGAAGRRKKKNVSFRITSIDDRLQNPLHSGYGDLQLTVAVDDHICELQLNVEPMADAKGAGGHAHYREERTENELLLLNAIKGNNQDQFSDLLAKGADPNAVKDKNGSSALHYAAFRGDLEMVQSLLAVGANPLTVNREFKSPVHDALMKMHFPVAALLLEAMLIPKNLETIVHSWCEPKAQLIQLIHWADDARPDWNAHATDTSILSTHLNTLREHVEAEGELLLSIPEALRGVNFTSRNLNLSGLIESDKELDYVNIQLKYHTFIETIDARSCKAGPGSFLGLGHSKSLRSLHLAFGLPSLACLEALAQAVATIPTLEDLSINNNYNLKGPGAIEAVVKLGQALRLPVSFKKLNVGGHNRIFEQDDGLLALMKGLGVHASLLSLSIFNNTSYSQRSHLALGEWIAKLPHFKELNVQAAVIHTAEEATALAKGLRGSASLTSILCDGANKYGGATVILFDTLNAGLPTASAWKFEADETGRDSAKISRSLKAAD